MIRDLPTNEAARVEIPVFFDELTICVNHALINGKFPSILKNANVTPVHKKDDPSDFRPVSVLPLLSKVFERIIYNQLAKCRDTSLNKLLCGFKKAHFTLHALFKLLQRCQEELITLGLWAQY